MARHPRARSPFLTSRRAFVVIRTGTRYAVVACECSLRAAHGAVGRYLIPSLVADGHQVIASTRSAGKSADLAAAGGRQGGSREGLLRLGEILPDDQGGGAVLWPEHHDGKLAGTRAPRR